MNTSMQCEADTVDSAVGQFARLRNYRPFAYSGKWFVAKVGPQNWRTFRTKKAAMNNTTEAQIYAIEL